MRERENEKTTYVHFDAGVLKDLRVGILARREAVKLQLATIKLNRIERCPIQLILAAQHHRLAATHCRRLYEQVDIAQRRLGGIWKGARGQALWDLLFKLMQRAWVCHSRGQQETGSRHPVSRQSCYQRWSPQNRQLPGRVLPCVALRSEQDCACLCYVAAICIHGRGSKTILIRRAVCPFDDQRLHPSQPQHRHRSAFYGHCAA